jgi:hypothetical protein
MKRQPTSYVNNFRCFPRLESPRFSGGEDVNVQAIISEVGLDPTRFPTSSISPLGWEFVLGVRLAVVKSSVLKLAR